MAASEDTAAKRKESDAHAKKDKKKAAKNKNKPDVKAAASKAPRHTSVAGIPVGLADPQDDPGREAQVPVSQRRFTAADKTTPTPPSRWSLRMSAAGWRAAQYVGMSLHYLASPRPPAPAFTRTIPSTLSPRPGTLTLHFYTPPGYKAKDGGDNNSNNVDDNDTVYPAVINFHGGGFVLGSGTDDARFFRYLLTHSGAVVVSVDYRLAPEHPFPTAVEDGADALLYVIRNAAALRIDPMRLATSGFSAGANLCFTSLLRLGAYAAEADAREPEAPDEPDEAGAGDAGAASTTRRPPPPLPPVSPRVPDHRVVAAVAWCPTLDFTLSRAERRAACTRPDQALPTTLTDLFDASYLYPPDLDLRDPCLSPAQATDVRLARDMPQHVQLYTCEWDMLQREGADFAARLGRPPLDRNVFYKMIPGVPHGWEKSPNPLKLAEGSEDLYRECGKRLKAVFDAAAGRPREASDAAE
ncbi:Alpha/beta hydrolase fold-3 [Niveomyces insectorum RCEF 264]|uniref:Alpha/beta hydrolase fold-3 n=1 Tax=Niveomyces insectorum RCEF 264 TaxID=1081102 RepID=A0A167QDT1_9HYPO|nr:Alpha/beta hydrolase fold-3 [Niveomyces insectorum RCEF 264]